jgi:hypothetical protein
MTKIRINKIDAARRQIDAAIRMTFGEEDPVAIIRLWRRLIGSSGIFASDAATFKAIFDSRTGLLQVMKKNSGGIEMHQQISSSTPMRMLITSTNWMTIRLTSSL